MGADVAGRALVRLLEFAVVRQRRAGAVSIPVFLALVFCLMGSSAQQSCVEAYPDEPVAGLAACAVRGQQLAAQWLEEHVGYEFSHVRCRIGEPFPHRQEI